MPDFDPYYQWLGISKEDQPASHYRLLGVREGESNLDVIENAADRQMVFLRQHAAGKYGSYATKLLNEVTRARLVLLNPEMKSAYDRGLQLTEPKITSKAPKPVLPAATEIGALEEKDPFEDIPEPVEDSIPVVSSTTGSIAVGGRRGRLGQKPKKNPLLIVAGTGGLIVGLILLIVVLNSILSPSDEPTLADGSQNNNSSIKPPRSSSTVDTQLGGVTSGRRDDDGSHLPTVPEDVASAGGTGSTTSTGGTRTSTGDTSGGQASPVRTVISPPDLDSATSFNPTTTTVVDDPSPLTNTAVVMPRPVITPVMGFDRTVPGGPVGYWPISLGETTTVADLAGTYEGTLEGGATIESDGEREAFVKLDGTSGYVSLGNPPELDIQGEITVAAWVRIESTGSVQNIVSHGHCESPRGEVCLRIQRGQIDFGSWNGGNYQVSTRLLPGDVGRWMHLAGVYDGANWRLYKDGIQASMLQQPVGAVSVKADWAIGARGGGKERFFNGAVDEVRIFDRAISEREVAELARAPLNGMPRDFASLDEDGRKLLSDKVMQASLAWLADHQTVSGAWSFDLDEAETCMGQCKFSGIYADARCAATGLALLAFFGAGQTHRSGDWQDTVKEGLLFLVKNGKANDNGISWEDQEGGAYSHAIATLAICEAYRLTKDQTLRPVAQLGIQYVAHLQDAENGGWRYRLGAEPDISISNLMLDALKSGHHASLEIPTEPIERAKPFFASLAIEGGAESVLRKGADANYMTSAVGLMGRLTLGMKKENPILQKGTELLTQWGPSKTDVYYNYYATKVMHSIGGKQWNDWNTKLRDFLFSQQSKEGHERGSWFLGGTEDGTSEGGRLYQTALSILAIEIQDRASSDAGNVD